MKEDRVEPVLEHLVAEARREPVPDLDWGAIEASLMSRLGQSLPAVRRGPVFRPWVVALGAAALAGAAAAAVGVVQHRGPLILPAVAVSATATQKSSKGGAAVNGDSLAVGDIVHSDDAPLVVEHPNHARWTLEPGSVAHVEELGDVIRVALDRGVLSARVVKSPRPESFVVRVEGTRIAVHGTAFRVVRLDRGVRVEVSEGVVGVGPLSGPSFDVSAPASATTTFDGVRTDVRRAARGAPAKPGEHAREMAGAAPERPAEPETTPPSEAAPAASSGAPEVTLGTPAPQSSAPNTDVVVNAVRHCFREQTVTNGDLHVTVSTQVSLKIQPSGRIGEAVFTPPLAPGVRRCVDETVGNLAFAPSANGFAVDRVLELER